MLRRAAISTSSFAGSALAVSAALSIDWSAPPGQLPGYATGAGIDARAAAAIAGFLILGAMTGAAAGAAVARLISRRPIRTWAVVTFFASLLVIPVLCSTGVQSPLTVAPLLFTAVAVRFGRLNARFSREDFLLIPAFLAIHLATVELFSGLHPAAAFVLATGIVLGTRLLVSGIDTGGVPAGWAWIPAALILLLELDFSWSDQPLRAAIALSLGTLVPLATAPLLRAVRPPAAAIHRLAAWGIYPFAIVCLAHILHFAGLPVVNLFEHGFDLAAGSELLRGEHLYRDIVPQHGALADGAIDLIGLKLFGNDAGGALGLRYAVSLLNPLALYAFGWALSGSAALGLIGVLLDFALFPAPVMGLGELSPLLLLRGIPGIAALGLSVAAVRRRSLRLIGVAAATSALALLWSIDFGVYAVAALLVAVWRFSSHTGLRARALSRLVAGIALLAIPFAAWLLATGGLVPFVRMIWTDFHSFSTAYNLGLLTRSDCCPGGFRFPEILAATVTDRSSLAVLFGFAAVIALATGVALRPAGSSRRVDPWLVACAWVTVSLLSFAERKHTYYDILIPPLLAAAVLSLARARRDRRLAACAAVLLTIMVTHPFSYFLRAVPAAVREREEEVPKIYSRYELIPRAHGALFVREDIPKVEAIRGLLASQLGPGETFYTFTNLAILHFLFDRPVPVRYLEPPMYETAQLQREVVARLVADRSIRAAVVRFDYWSDVLDGVPNETRAPLVRDFLLREFPLVWRHGRMLVLLKRERPMSGP